MQVLKYFIQGICAFQVLWMFVEDSRWSNYRTYMLRFYGKNNLALVAGALLNLVFPIMFLLIDFCLKKFYKKISLKRKIVKLLIYSTADWRTIIQNLRNFKRMAIFGFMESLMFIYSLLVYVAVTLLILYTTSTFKITGYFCTDLQAQFLLSNNG